MKNGEMLTYIANVLSTLGLPSASREKILQSNCLKIAKKWANRRDSN